MNLSDIMDIGELDRLVAEHYITRRVNESGRYILHNYTEKATYDRVWTPETRQCRGIVSRPDGTIVAWPFDKFFNIGEMGTTVEELPYRRHGDVEITDKLDGSMVALWHADNAWHTSTRGSFTSSQAIAAMRWLAPHIPYDGGGLTLLLEYCAPDNRVVLKYDKPECVLIGARSTLDGCDHNHATLQMIANELRLSVTPRQFGALDALVSTRGSFVGVEGWVARWPDGFRVKIKTEDYLRLHRLVSGFSATRVRDVLLAAGDSWGAYLTDLPEEFRAEAERMAAVMRAATNERLCALCAAHARLAPLASESRKTYAIAVLSEPAPDRPYLFSLLDGKPIEQKVLASLDLESIGLATAAAE